MLNCDRKPSLLVITDIDEVRLKRASELFTEEYAKERGVEIHFVNTAKVDDPVKTLRDLTGEMCIRDRYTAVRRSCCMDSVDRISCNINGTLESECHFSSPKIIVNCLWKCYNI